MQETKKITDNKFLNLYSVKDNQDRECYISSRRDTEDLAYMSQDHSKCDAVIVIPILDNGRIALLKQYRAAINDYIYEFPGGLVEKDEIPLMTAIRELYEETRLECKSINELLKPCYSAVGTTDENVAVYICDAVGEPIAERAHFDENECIVSISVNDVDQFIKEGVIGFKTASLLLYLKAYYDKEDR